MAQTNERDFYTVAQAAEILEVSPTTVWRWIKADLLPAYRAGPKNIRIKKQDLERVITPAREPQRQNGSREEVSAMKEILPITSAVTAAPLDDDRARKLLAAVDRADELGAEMLARRQGKPLASSATLIREERDERSRELL